MNWRSVRSTRVNDAPGRRRGLCGRAAPIALSAGAALLLALAGCGDDSEQTTGGGVTGTSAEPGQGEPTIPELPRNDDPAAVVCTGPPRGTFDATAIVGDSVADAKGAAAEQGCSVRVAMRDGEGLALTQDFRPDRVNVAVEDGEVTEIIDIG